MVRTNQVADYVCTTCYTLCMQGIKHNGEKKNLFIFPVQRLQLNKDEQ